MLCLVGRLREQSPHFSQLRQCARCGVIAVFLNGTQDSDAFEDADEVFMCEKRPLSNRNWSLWRLHYRTRSRNLNKPDEDVRDRWTKVSDPADDRAEMALTLCDDCWQDVAPNNNPVSIYDQEGGPP
jgi:hypothetical protein